MGNIGVSIITFPFLSFSEALQKIESLGFKAVELWTEFPEVWKLDLNERINLFKEILPSFDFDLSIHTPITDINISSCNPKIQEISLKEIEETLILANKTGIKKAVVHGGFKPKEKPFNKLNKNNLNPYINQTSNGIKQILKQGEELEVEILVENAEHDEQHKILRTYNDFQTITNKINKEFSIVYDISHSLPAGTKKNKEFIKKMKNRIKELRAKHGLTQEQLAQIVGVRRETIIFLEQGKYNPSLRLAHNIAKILKTSVDELFIFDD